jgi:hypothetical protein
MVVSLAISAGLWKDFVLEPDGFSLFLDKKSKQKSQFKTNASARSGQH